MPNGKGLNGHYSSTQSAIIVPKPNDPTRYFVFTVDQLAGPNGLCYSVVNMALDGGKGDVEVKNVQLITPVCEKVTAVNHCNGKDIWIITHGWNSDVFYSYLVTSSGINMTPVVTHAGRTITGYYDRAIGYMKASPDGTKLALASNLMGVDLVDFNNSNGTISNPVLLNLFHVPYGVEFSPNSSLLYVTDFYYNPTAQPINALIQFEVNHPLASDIIASEKIVGQTNDWGIQTYAALQMAPDGKMYMALFNQQYVSVINNPDVIGSGCGFVQNAIDLFPNMSRFGLPTFIQSFWQGSFKIDGSCKGQQIQFDFDKAASVNAIKWDFGDPTSGFNNTSALSSVSHYYAAPGIYTVQLIRFNSCGSDTIRKQVQAGAFNFNLGSDTTLCGVNSYLLQPNVSQQGYEFLWQDSSTTQNFNANKNGLYWLEVKDDQTGCSKRDSIKLTFQPSPKFDLGNDISKCESDTVMLNVNVPGANYLWNTGSVSSSITINKTGIYWLDVSLNGCTKRDSVNAVFNPYPKVSLGRDTILCDESTLLLNAQNTNAQYFWQDGTTSPTMTVHAPGIYSVKVTSNGCSTTSSINVIYKYKPRFSLGPDVQICKGESVLLRSEQKETTGISFLWQDGSTQSSLLASEAGLYSLNMSNYCGSVTDTIEVVQGVCKLYVPNAFTPNGDGLNDIFRARFGENITKFKMEIYDRWGEKVFESNDIKHGWDGTYQKTTLTGVFVWVIKYDTTDLKDQIMKGTVFLIR